MNNVFDSVESCIAAFKKGEFVVVADDENRENEGDLIIALRRSLLKPSTSGPSCARPDLVPMTQNAPVSIERSQPQPRGQIFHRLHLPVDAANNITIGISRRPRRDRAALVDDHTTPADIVSPDTFPLRPRAALVRLLHRGDCTRPLRIETWGVICEIMHPTPPRPRLPTCTPLPGASLNALDVNLTLTAATANG